MERTKKYNRVLFPPEVIRQAADMVAKACGQNINVGAMRLSVTEDEEWKYDDEEEFFAAYIDPFRYAQFSKLYHLCGSFSVVVWGETKTRDLGTTVTVEMQKREQILGAFNIFEANVERCKLPERPREEPRKGRVFIGHGRDKQWRELKDHLHDKHGLDVEAYEIGARAGLTVQEVLDEMLTNSSLAVLVLTGEDEDAQGKMHARENVVHELGLFQGRLGRRRAIILLEEEVQEFSNIQGVNQIRFKKSGIGEAYGDVLATIRREFG